MKGYLYIIRNYVTPLVYIGQTVQDLHTRFLEHINKSKKCNSKFYRAIREIGKHNFYIELLEECDSSELDNKEKYYIAKFDSFHNGYNSTLGGFGTPSYELDEDYIVELYKQYGIQFIANQIGCCTKVIRSILVRNNVQIRDTNIEAIPVLMLDTKYNVLNTFLSKKDAWRWLINNYRANMTAGEAYHYIKQACEIGSTAFGYKWMYLYDIEDINDTRSILDNAELQKYTKNNKIKVKGTKSFSNTKDKSEYKKAGKPGTPCYMIVEDTRVELNLLKIV